LLGQILLWFQLMEDGKFVSTNSYFTSFYFFTALHGLHLLGGLFFWGKVCSQILKLDEKNTDLLIGNMGEDIDRMNILISDISKTYFLIVISNFSVMNCCLT